MPRTGLSHVSYPPLPIPARLAPSASLSFIVTIPLNTLYCTLRNPLATLCLPVDATSYLCCFNPCFLRLLCNCIHGRSSQPGILCFNPCFPGPFCNSVYGKMFRLLSLSCFNPCFLRLLCNLLLVTTKHMGSIISILVFVDLFATNLFFKRKALPKELYFCSAISETPNLFFLDQTFF